MVHQGSFAVDGESALCILLEIRVFMRWCEDLVWDHPSSPHKSQLCSSLKVEFLQYPFTLTIGESEREHFAVMLAAQLAQRGELVVDYVRLNIPAKREVAA